MSHDFPAADVVPVHFHHEDQLVYACQGVMTVQTSEGTWVVPPQRAVWIPGRTPHSIVIPGPASMRALYLRPRLVRSLPRNCCVLNVSLLLKELIVHACKFPTLNRRIRIQAHLVDVLVDQLETVQAVPLQLPSPSDQRAVKVADLLSADPGDQRALEEICRIAGASRRTIERVFQQETHMTLGEWRQQLRLTRSLQLLAAGEEVTHVALETGYSTPSSFIAMFKRVLGVTPGRYFENGAAPDGSAP